ncbi:hypothetical protein NDU88_000310, partial [Pleurodeles waltl]
ATLAKLIVRLLPYKDETRHLPDAFCPKSMSTGDECSALLGSPVQCSANLEWSPVSAILEPGSAILEPGSAILEPGSAILEPGSAILEPGSAILEPGSAILEPVCVLGPD